MACVHGGYLVTAIDPRGRSPFLTYDSFSQQETEPLPIYTRRSAVAQRSPFVSVYEAGEDQSVFEQPVREAYVSFVDELHDEEFEDALSELESHVRSVHQAQLSQGVSRPAADRLAAQYLAPLIRESEAAVSALARDFGPREGSGFLDEEVDSFLEEQASSVALAPEFEQLFGSLLRKVGSAAKAAVGKAWQGIKQVGLAPILNKIRSLIRPMLDKVLQKALGYLPVAVQPAAKRLAQKLGFMAPTAAAPANAAAPAATAEPAAGPEPLASVVQDVAGSEGVSLSQEFNEQIAQAFLAQDEAELELEMLEGAAPSRALVSPAFAELDDAREQFISELTGLRQGESAEPHIERFLPAVLPALRLGMRLIGRPRLMSFLSPLLARLITSLIGPEGSEALSKAIVDAGLKLLSLEVDDEATLSLAPSAVASTVEETVGRIASLPDHVLDDQELLEGYALEAFEQAAASNLPALFSEATYQKRPELLEAGVNAGWVMLPLRGPKRYKKCSRVFKVRISPHLAEEVEGFEGERLADYLHDRIGMPEGAEIEAELHLYEALPGTQLADMELDTEADGLAEEAAPSQLHPLTPQAAATLLGKPGLGRPLSASSIAGRISGGQRFYRLHVPGARSPYGSKKAQRARRAMHVNLQLDGVKDEIRLTVFLSEAKAQKLAVRLRQGTHRGVLSSAFHRSLGSRLDAIVEGRAPRRFRLVHAALRPGQSPALLLRNLPRASALLFSARLQAWLVQGFSELIKNDAARVIGATEDAAEGLTLQFRIPQPAGLKQLTQMLFERSEGPSALEKAFSAQRAPKVEVQVCPGHRCG